MNSRRFLFRIIAFSITIILLIGILVYEFITTGKISSTSIKTAVFLFIGAVVSALKIFSNQTSLKNLSLKKYESIYKDIIENAFSLDYQKKYREKLLQAIDLYHRDEYIKAIKSLVELFPNWNKNDDRYAILLFLALCYTEIGANEDAINTYNNIINFDQTKSTVWSNLGILLSKKGEYDNSIKCYEKAIELDENNAYAYSNIASAYMYKSEFEAAIKYALKAFNINSKLTVASNNLAICYNVLGNKEEANKYFRISITNGVNEQALREAMAKYKIEI